MLTAARLWRRRKTGAADEPSLEADLRQVLIMAGAMTSIGLMLLTGIAALIRGDPRPPAPTETAATAPPAASPRLAVALNPQRIDLERRRDGREDRPLAAAPVRLRGSARAPEPQAAADAVATAPPDLSLAPPPAPEIVSPEAEEAQRLEEAPFLRGPAEPIATTVPPGPAADAAPAAPPRQGLRERLSPRNLAGVVARSVPGLRSRSDEDAVLSAPVARTDE